MPPTVRRGPGWRSCPRAGTDVPSSWDGQRMAFVDVRSPISRQMLKSINSELTHVQFVSALSDADYRAVAERMRSFHDVSLRAYGSYDGTITNLEFLRHFPFLRSFQADALYHSLVNIEGLAYLPEDVRFIGLG